VLPGRSQEMQPRQTLPRRARHIIAVGFALLLITDATAFAATRTRAPGASTEAAMRAAVGKARSHPVMHRSAAAEIAAAIYGQEAAMRASVGKAKIDAITHAPFARQALQAGSSGEAFNWTDGAIGLLAGIAISLSAAAVLLIARKSPLTAS
jgi:hypothetical protein